MNPIDTNVLLKFLTADDPVQAETVNKLFKSASAKGETVFVPLFVLVETVWVLRRGYKLKKPLIVEAIQDLLLHTLFEIENREVAEAALDSFRRGQADFSDYVIAHGCAIQGKGPLGTFDRNCKEPQLFKQL